MGSRFGRIGVDRYGIWECTLPVDRIKSRSCLLKCACLWSGLPSPLVPKVAGSEGTTYIGRYRPRV
jgi:hypothetical protein